MIPTSRRPDSYLAWAILSTFLFIPFGIAAIVQAAKVNSSWAAGERADAHRYSQSARKWATVAAICGAVVIGVNVAIVIAVSIATNS